MRQPLVDPRATHAHILHNIALGTLLCALCATACADPDATDPTTPHPKPPRQDMAQPDMDLPHDMDPADLGTDQHDLPLVGASLGEPCQAARDCQRQLACDLSAQGGYCRPTSCSSVCEERGGLCVGVGGHSAQCWATCEPDAELRDGHRCIKVTDNALILIPESAPRELVTAEQIEDAFLMRCTSRPGEPSAFGPTREFDFILQEDDASFMLTLALPIGEGSMTPVSLLLPDATTLDLVEDYRHHNARLGDVSLARPIGVGAIARYGLDWSILFPYAPQFASLVQPGVYTLRVASPRADICLYVLTEKEESSARIDLNLYFVTRRSLGAVSATSDADFQEVLSELRTIYQAAGLDIGTVRYFDVTETVSQQYSVLRDMQDLRELTAQGRPISASRDPNLSIDIFLVSSINLQGANVLGLSGGIPGAPGLHGNLTNGLAFSTENIGFDNRLVAHVMAHEIGHFLGLRHTTEFIVGTPQQAEFERFVGAYDPIEDTPECPTIRANSPACPDRGNLMFPASPFNGEFSSAILTEGQRATLLASPLTR